MSKKLSPGRIILNIVLALVLIVLVALFLFIRGTRHIPQVYKDTIAVSIDRRRRLSGEFTSTMMQMGMKMDRDESFSELIPTDQLNAWIQYGFETREEFIPPRLGVVQVHVLDGRFILMAKIKPPRWHTMIVSLHLRPVQQPDGTLGFEVVDVLGGRISLPRRLLPNEIDQLEQTRIDLGRVAVQPADGAVKVTFKKTD